MNLTYTISENKLINVIDDIGEMEFELLGAKELCGLRKELRKYEKDEHNCLWSDNDPVDPSEIAYIAVSKSSVYLITDNEEMLNTILFIKKHDLYRVVVEFPM